MTSAVSYPPSQESRERGVRSFIVGIGKSTRTISPPGVQASLKGRVPFMLRYPALKRRAIVSGPSRTLSNVTPNALSVVLECRNEHNSRAFSVVAHVPCGVTRRLIRVVSQGALSICPVGTFDDSPPVHWRVTAHIQKLVP